ncbi:hypothetical protein BD289DRAFT_20503 [Coniella lustricola]|uniref:Secreted protein n=1 Tax=Coniella lustricola TaxID=2025994 RepID=A0A2T3A3S1_9PEZI|nr:hypothetical protein BD289DRAFT_20503 [Coniella lustricola]
MSPFAAHLWRMLITILIPHEPARCARLPARLAGMPVGVPASVGQTGKRVLEMLIYPLAVTSLPVMSSREVQYCTMLACPPYRPHRCMQATFRSRSGCQVPCRATTLPGCFISFLISVCLRVPGALLLSLLLCFPSLPWGNLFMNEHRARFYGCFFRRAKTIVSLATSSTSLIHTIPSQLLAKQFWPTALTALSRAQTPSTTPLRTTIVEALNFKRNETGLSATHQFVIRQQDASL